ncbi:hypothetical protein [Arenibaculum sp.]|jgi:hypothetical protein|uniref:hypothetical protein n=1 Tax=Arenibaculum sp. TaxID=2865862 RepID=UPI002E0E5228|nr:hypothetical protein [Arenibaculum sp.]
MTTPRDPARRPRLEAVLGALSATFFLLVTLLPIPLGLVWVCADYAGLPDVVRDGLPIPVAAAGLVAAFRFLRQGIALEAERLYQ